MVSLLQLYSVIIFIKTGSKPYNYDTRVPKKMAEYIKSHFNLTYDRKARKYTADENEVFKILKDDYPDFFKNKYIDNYLMLYTIVSG